MLPNGDIASASSDCKIKIWDHHNKDYICGHILTGHEMAITSLLYLPVDI
jgi:WD40 repeat protein